MSESLLNFINNILKFPYKIIKIEREFQNGFLFGELLRKSGNYKGKLSKYIENPENNSEIKENFKSLQNDLRLMEIFINNSTINDLISGKEGVAPKLIYKIKTEMDRIKINFSDIVQKINENSYREKYELGKNKIINNLNQKRLLELTQSNKFSMSPSITTRVIDVRSGVPPLLTTNSQTLIFKVLTTLFANESKSRTEFLDTSATIPESALLSSRLRKAPR